jgi:hypothetical protein
MYYALVFSYPENITPTTPLAAIVPDEDLATRCAVAIREGAREIEVLYRGPEMQDAKQAISTRVGAAVARCVTRAPGRAATV